MSLTNADIAERLLQLSELLRHEGENRFKVKAYRAAARGLRTFPRSASEMVAHGEPLTSIPGVGKGISGAIQELVSTGTLAKVEKLRGDHPPGVVELAGALNIPLRDAARVLKAAGNSSPDGLRHKLQEGELKPMGARLDSALRRALGVEPGRQLWHSVEDDVERWLGYLGEIQGVSRVEAAGSFRRRKETVGTLRFVVQADAGDAVRAALQRHAALWDIVSPARDALEARQADGLGVRVRWTAAASWGDAMVEETGSRAHVKDVSSIRPDTPGPCESEEKYYASRALPFIPPELREGRGEVDAARAGALPALVSLDDIRGDLHAHTTASDGANTLEEMARAARARGYEYLGITDHSQSLKIAHGLDEARLRAQIAEIDRFNKRYKKFRLLKGSEVDILADGSLDFPDDLLAQLDIVICSIHSRFSLNKEQQTRRILKALEHPAVTCIGHMTGRLLLKRPGYEVDVPAVLAAARRHAKLLEINSSPDRLDLSDELARMALDAGVPLLINTDAHSTRELDFMRLGVQQARRAWQTRATIVNTLPLPQLMERIAQTRVGTKAATSRSRRR